MSTGRISKRVIDALVLRDKEHVCWDPDLTGFGVRVRPSGTKSFVVVYRVGGGRRSPQRKVTIGAVGKMEADQARTTAREILSKASLGVDFALDKQKQRRELTISQFCDLYLAEGCDTKKPSTISTDRGRIERHIKPLLGRKRVSEVTRADVERFMRDVSNGKTAVDERTKLGGRSIVRGGKGAATRTVGLLGGIMSFAVSCELRSDNPVRGVKRHPDKKGERFLSPAELARLGKALAIAELAGANASGVAIIRLLALTGARKSEITSLNWHGVDLETGFLRLGDSKTGAKLMPLGAPAREVLAGLPVIDGSGFVFPATTGTGHFQGAEKIWRRVRSDAQMPELRLHDLRHSFASIGLAGGSALAAIGAILGHADVKTTSGYAHLAGGPHTRSRRPNFKIGPLSACWERHRRSCPPQGSAKVMTTLPPV